MSQEVFYDLTDRQLGASTADHLRRYEAWLLQTVHSKYTRRDYRYRIKSFLLFVETYNNSFDVLLTNKYELEQLVRKYRTYLRKSMKSTSINSHLTAIDSLLQSLGLGAMRVERDYRLNGNVAPTLTRAELTPAEKAQFLAAVATVKNVKHRAIATLISCAGIGIRECTVLKLADIKLCEEGGVIVRRLRHQIFTEDLPLNVVNALREWLDRRQRRFSNTSNDALFLNEKGGKMSVASIDFIIRNIGHSAHLNVSTKQLRRAYLQRCGVATNAHP